MNASRDISAAPKGAFVRIPWMSVLLAACSCVVFPAVAGSYPSRLIESHRRDGYTAELREIYPDDFLAVKTYVLVPDGAKPGSAPAVVCMADSRGSIQHLAGEPDPYGCTNVDLGRKAYYAAKAGYVAMALALPGCANGAPDDIDSDDSRRRYLSLLPDSGWTDEMLVKRELEKCVELLKSMKVVDSSRISVMGSGEGAVIVRAAAKLQGIAASGDIMPDCECRPPHPIAPPPHLATGKRMMSERDYEPERPDGRTERTFVWAMRRLRENCRPRMPDALKDEASFREYLDGRREALAKSYGWGDVSCEFKLLKEERRDGYTLKTYEFYPHELLAVKTLFLVPDGAKPGKTPAVICLPGSGASIWGLAGEKGDPYYTRYPIRNRQAWWYCKAGMIGVAMDNFADGNCAHDRVNHHRSKQMAAKLAERFTLDGKKLDRYGYTTWVFAHVVNFLKKDPLVDTRKIAVSGLSLGSVVIYPAISNPDIVACCYNDFAPYNGAKRQSVVRVSSDVCHANNARGAGNLTWIQCAPKHLLLNEGGAYRGVIEYVERAYALAGCPERLTVHYYDRYSYAPKRKWDATDLLDARDYDQEDFCRHNNCDPYDHSFHPESALPWMCRIFFGSDKLSPELERELLRAGAERETNPFKAFPPDARRGRKAVGRTFSDLLNDSDLVPERPDGRTEKTATWCKMMCDRQKGLKVKAQDKTNGKGERRCN